METSQILGHGPVQPLDTMPLFQARRFISVEEYVRLVQALTACDENPARWTLRAAQDFLREKSRAAPVTPAPTDALLR